MSIGRLVNCYGGFLAIRSLNLTQLSPPAAPPLGLVKLVEVAVVGGARVT